MLGGVSEQSRLPVTNLQPGTCLSKPFGKDEQT